MIPKSFRLVVFALLAFHASPAQKPKIDSLENVLSLISEKGKADVLNRLSELSRATAPAKSISYAQDALVLAQKFRDRKQEILAMKNIAIGQGYENKYNLALETLQQSLALAERYQEWALAGDNSINIGTIQYVVLANHQKGLEYYLKALGLFEKVNYQKGIAAALSGIGIAYTDEKRFAEALETLQRSLDTYVALNEKREIPKIHVNIGSCYQKMGEYGQALSYLKVAVDGFEATNNPRGKAHALFVIAQIHRTQKNFDAAIATLNGALVLNEKSNHKNSISDCYLELGKTHLDMKNNTTAETYFLRVVDLAEEINKKEHISEAYKNLSSIYASNKNYEKAFRYLELHKLTYDSLFDAEKSKQIAEMQARFDSERKEKEIVLLRQEKSLNQIYLFLAIGALISISTIGFLIINRQKLKMKKDRELAEKESQLMEERRTLFESELRNRELTEQQLQSQLEYKNKELASYTLNLIQKNEILENLKEAVEEIRNSSDAMIKQKLNGLVNMVNYSFHLDRDWENFKVHFEQVHRDFFKKLLEKYPDLSANDLKLCSLIKLNLDNRGIAAILNISQESAKVARHRLRKKLELGADQTLIAFLNTVE